MVVALILPATFTLTDLLKSLEFGATPVHEPSVQFPAPNPIVPSLTSIVKFLPVLIKLALVP